MYTLEQLVKAILIKEVKLEDVAEEYLPLIEGELLLAKSVADNKELLKTNEHGQWELVKTNTLNYGKINPRQNASVNPEAKETADTAAKENEAKAPSINFGNKNNITVSNPWKVAPKAKGPAAPGNTALDEIKRRQEEAKKSELSGVDDMGMLSQGEKEPHEDDPQHEQKEKKKAKKIKKEAQSLLDMHKEY